MSRKTRPNFERICHFRCSNGGLHQITSSLNRNVFDESMSAQEISNVSMKALPFTFALMLTFTKIVRFNTVLECA
jgi:hypothetical protein